jgi:hypothetical protein
MSAGGRGRRCLPASQFAGVAGAVPPPKDQALDLPVSAFTQIQPSLYRELRERDLDGVGKARREG